MNPPASSPGKYRTGLFEIDLASGQLHKNGRRLPLQEQPFRVLAVLLECPGEVVTRQQLQARLWPADTYVGFDEGLNTAIRKLRTAFGDSATNPRFIETLPRRGYRFIAPVTETANCKWRARERGFGMDGRPRCGPRLWYSTASGKRSNASGLPPSCSGRWQMAMEGGGSTDSCSGFGSHSHCIHHAYPSFLGFCSR